MSETLVKTWWFKECPLKGKDGCNQQVFKKWYCCSQENEQHARFLLWNHLARSGKHFGLYTAEELCAICNNCEIQVSNSLIWGPEIEVKYPDAVIPTTEEEAVAMYTEFASNEHIQVEDGEAAIPEDEQAVVASSAMEAFRNSESDAFGEDIKELIITAARLAAAEATSQATAQANAAAATASKANATTPSKRQCALARREGVARIGADLCVISKQLLSSFADAVDRGQAQLVSARACLVNAVRHFDSELVRIKEVTDYMREAERRAFGWRDDRGDGHRRGKDGRGGGNIPPVQRPSRGVVAIGQRTRAEAPNRRRSRSRGERAR
jgi:hypothetical protein